MKCIKFKEIKDKFPKDSWIYEGSEASKGELDEEIVLYIEGDLKLENLDLSAPEASLKNQFKNCEVSPGDDLIMTIFIQGNLLVKNIFYDDSLYHPSASLVVTGDLIADNMFLGDQEIYVMGNATIRDFFYGGGNFSGYLRCRGRLKAQVVMQYNPYTIHAKKYNVQHDIFTSDYRTPVKQKELYFNKYLKKIFVPEVLYDEQEIRPIEYIHNVFNCSKILERLRSGKRILQHDDLLKKIKAYKPLDVMSFLKKLAGKSVEEIAEAIKKHEIEIKNVFEFAYTLPAQQGLYFYQAILSLPIPKTPTERNLYINSANNAIVAACTVGKWEEAVRLSDAFIQYVEEDLFIAHSAACAYARTGNKEKALELVELAIHYNYENIEMMEKDVDLDPIKDDPRFADLFKHWRKVSAREAEELTPTQDFETFEAKEVKIAFYETKDVLATKQKKNLKGFIEKQASLAPEVYQKIFDFYKEAYPDYKEGWMSGGLSEGEVEESLPSPTSAEALKPFLTLTAIHMPCLRECREGTMGLLFDCTWDEENGIGVLIEHWKVTQAGHADVAYLFT